MRSRKNAKGPGWPTAIINYYQREFLDGQGIEIEAKLVFDGRVWGGTGPTRGE